MAIASFEALCSGFCEIAGVTQPALDTGIEGIEGFHARLHDVTVDVLHSPERSKDHIFVLVGLGDLDAGDAAARRTLEALLDANFTNLDTGAPTYCRNPVTGEVMMQRVVPFFEATPTGLYALVDSGVEMALSWRQEQDEGARAWE